MTTGGQTWVETVTGFEISSNMLVATRTPEIRLDTTNHRLTGFALNIEAFHDAIVECYIRYTDANNYIRMRWGDETVTIDQKLAGVVTKLITRTSAGTYCEFDCQIASGLITVTWRTWCPHGWQDVHVEKLYELLTDGDALRIVVTSNPNHGLVVIDDIVIVGTER